MIQKRITKSKQLTQSPPSPADWPGVIIELHPAPNPCDAFLRLSHLPHCVFFDSALINPELGRYSFIAADPFETIISSADDRGVWDKLQHVAARFVAPTLPNLPPFQGGLAGLFSYDLSRSLERLPPPRFNEFQIPGLAAGLYDVVIAFDHLTEKAWVVSQGFPEIDPLLRQRRAQARVDFIQGLLNQKDVPRKSFPIPHSPFPISHLRSTPAATASRLNDRLLSNFSRDEYLAAVQRGIEYIFAGDVFQVNLAQRLSYPAQDDAVSLYLRLRERNPATFAAYFDGGDFQIVSASPERFLQLREHRIEARPIKGTRPRCADPENDAQAAHELQTSQKDLAENVMIVDLLRNDLSRVCRPESVVVSELCRLERYAFVQHLVSVVQGELRHEFNAIDLLKAAFPGGSVTGTPKVRAMEIIAELEPTARGAYCGALGYIGFDGTLDSSILIRTITAGGGWWQIPVGGGIVAQSDPAKEYDETWHKAEGMLRALT